MENGYGTTRSTMELVKDIATDGGLLVRKEIELAKRELTESIKAQATAAVAFAVAGVVALFGLGFAASAVAAALDLVWPTWAARLLVAGAFFLFALALIPIGVGKWRSLVPRETTRTVKEDFEWAKEQLKR